MPERTDRASPDWRRNAFMVWNRGWTVHAILTGVKNGSDQTGGRIGIISQLLLLRVNEVGLIKNCGITP